MKHLGRWLICLAFVLNTALFVALITLGIAMKPVFLAISLICYPLSLVIIRLARIHINSKCRFYREDDPIWWKLLKTILMPIVASGALIMYHLITTTFRKMNDAVEDSTGFSIASIIRTIKAFLLYFVAGIILYFVTSLISGGDYSADDIVVGLLILGGIIWLSNHILWDVLDFAQRESDRFIKIKNISFITIAAICAAWGFIYFPGSIPEEKNFADLFGQFGMMVAPLGIHFFYYAIVRAGRVPQSKMIYFWGPIAMATVYVYSLLIGLIATSGKAFVLIFYILTVLAYASVIYFVGFPFFYSDGEYRKAYRELSKEKRLARAQAAEASSSQYANASSSAVKNVSNAKIYDAAFKVQKMFGYGSSVHISSIASINNIKLYPQSTEANDVSYDLYYTLNIDLRGKDSTAADLALSAIKRDFQREIVKVELKIRQKTIRELQKIGVDISNSKIHIYHKGVENIRT